MASDKLTQPPLYLVSHREHTHIHFFLRKKMSNDKSCIRTGTHVHAHAHMHMCMQHAHGHTGGLFVLRERTTLWGRGSRDTLTHTHPGVWRDIGSETRHTSLRGTGFGYCIRYSYFIFVRTGTSHRSKPRASLDLHTPHKSTRLYPTSNFFVSSNPRRSDTWTCLLQRAHITWRARTPHSTSLGLAFWCDGAGPHPPTFRPHARDGHPARPTPHDVCELT